MKILHVLAQLPARTGSGIYYRNLIGSLRQYGHRQQALFARQDDSELDLLEHDQQYAVQFLSPELPFAIPGMSDIMPYESTVYGQMDEHMLELWTTAFREKLLQAAREFEPQAVILHHLWMLTSMAAEIFPNAVKIGVCHNTDLRQAVQNPHLVSRYLSGLHQLDAVFALSEEQRQPIFSLCGLPQEKVIVLGGGYDQETFYPPSVPKEARREVQLVYASKIDPAKGVYALLDAFDRVRAAGLPVHLHLVGTPNEENAPRIEARAGQHPHITLYPAMKQQDLAQLFRTSDLYVMPSFFEGLGLTAVEALACGLRVVAAENSGLKQLLSDRINRSGVIEYVPLPPMEAIDKPKPEGLPVFSHRLAEKLELQAHRILAAAPWPDDVTAQLAQYSWQGIAARANREIEQLAAFLLS